uniref:O-acyltransferase WSD1 C-terminal domain-containing protein n=1 Tax=Kalanchoe fedtschenkoi TaxID=63787 RepID=A0A7N0VAD1_KALFE
MKIIKNSVSPNATINDVVLGVLSLGLSEYMHLRSPDAIREGTRLTAITMSNLRSASGFPDISDLMKGDKETGWGNKIGFMLHPIYIRKPGNSTDPLWHLKEAQLAMNKKKQSKSGRMSYIFGSLAMKIISVDFAAWLMYRMACHSAFLFSNTMGPQQEIYMAGNLVTSIKASASSSPQAMTIHMVSYAGKAVMQILTAENLIPDPHVLAKCFEEALRNMKKRAALISPPKHQQ